MSMRWIVVLMVAGAAISYLSRAGTSSKGSLERPVFASKAAPRMLSQQVRDAGPTSPADVAAALHRVFADVVVMEQDRPEFLTGDFNGDGYQDVIVVVRARNGKLSDINDELANWSIQSPTRAYHPPRGKRIVRMPESPQPERVAAGETLLAVIHGYGPDGWRNPLARQSYLLRGVAGQSMNVEKMPEEVVRDMGRFPSTRNVVAEDFAGTHGFLYWTGATYAWYAEAHATGKMNGPTD